MTSFRRKRLGEILVAKGVITATRINEALVRGDNRQKRIGEILLAEGLRWRKQETWFGERVDPEFAEKRGSSRNSTPSQSLEA